MQYNHIHCKGLLVTILLLLAYFSTVSQAKIVFTSKRNDDTLYHIYVMEDNGSNVRRITNPAFYDKYPRWFPDGKQIMFQRDLTQGSGFNSEFYIIDVNGGNEHNFMANHPTDDFPVLSPNGKQIAFTSKRAGEWDIYTYHLEIGHLKQLTDNFDADGWSAWSYDPDWSPDGKKIAYKHSSEAEGSNIWTMNADGKRKHRLSPLHKQNASFLNRRHPIWSPSGKYIMYAEQELAENLWNGDLEKLAGRIVIQNVNTGVREEHDFPIEDTVYTGCWMGNDRTVLLLIKMDWDDPDANYDIYRYDLVSRKLKNLTKLPGDDYDPHWIEGSLAVFSLDKLTVRWGQLKQTD